MSIQRVSYQTNDIYKAAYLLARGATLQENGVALRKLAKNEIEKKGYLTTYVFKFDDVSKHDLETWSDATAQVNIRQYKDARLKLKKIIYKLQKEHHGY